MKDNGIVTAFDTNEIMIIGDWVYIRKNIKEISTDDITYYQFEEKQYTKDEYLSLLHAENKELKETLDILLGVDDE